MNLLLSAKGGDVTAWRAVENFTAAYRQALLDLAASGLSGSAETVFSETSASLETAISTHQELLQRLDSLTEELSAVPSTCLAPMNGISALTKSFSAKESQKMTSNLLKELTVAFYNDLYRYFGLFRAVPAFYQLSMTFLRQASAAIIAQATEQLGLVAGHLPEMTLIAVGPAGRCEYSPFCPLQILLVHGEVAASQRQTIELFCHALHAGFEDAGLAVDPVVTPRNARWRGTLTEWQQRCEDGLHPQADEELIDLCRLVDQYPLYPAEGFARELKRISSAALSGNRPALINLIERMTSLSNGLGFMGRLKLERSGSERGMFKLLDHGLLPLSAALSALTLFKESGAVGSCERIRDLLRQRELDVELAERMLATWHSLNDLRLQLEQSFHIDGHANRSLCLNPNELTDKQRQSLKEALESVAIIQRHVAIIFSGMGE
ncbi:MAG: hypothetical protein PVSMB11_04070 [Desulfuromonadaceae bacterium]